MKTKKKVNKDLFERCKDELGCKSYDVISILLSKHADGDIPLLDINPEVEDEYFYKDMFLESIDMFKFSITLNHELGKEMKDYETLNILMYNFLN